MKVDYPIWPRITLLIFLAWNAFAAMAGSLQLASVIGSSSPPPAGGAGDSMMPIISADGRVVLFASTANNLMLNTNGNPIPTPLAPRLNVYLRDRTNGTTTLVSINLSGIAGGNGDSIPTEISTNGQFVLFEGSASDLVANDTNGASDVFIRDVVNRTTTLVSVSTNGGSAIADRAIANSRNSVMTPDGRYVAFVSTAANLVSDDSNGIPDVFVRDMESNTTILVSVGATSTGGAAASSSELPCITPDGRYVAIFSTATNLVPGVTNSGEIYVRDLVGGTTVWASMGAHAILPSCCETDVCYNAVISDDGQYVAYEAGPLASPSGAVWPGAFVLRYSLQNGLTDIVNSNATGVTIDAQASTRTLDMTPDGRFIDFVGQTNGSSCIYLWDAQTGITTLVSGNLSNLVPPNSTCDWPTMDPSGRFIAFICSTNLTSNSLVGSYQLYLRDTQAGITTLVNADTNGVGSGVNPTSFPRLSADARFVAFEAPDGNLVPNDNNRDYDIFVRDLLGGTNELISAHATTLQSVTPNGPSPLFTLSVSLDGRYIAFGSEADNLVINDTNGCGDVFERDLSVGTNFLVSVATNGMSGSGLSTEPSISGDGRYVAFTSSATNIVAKDNNNAQDVFRRDLQSGTTVLVSVSTDGIHPGSGGSISSASHLPTISADCKRRLKSAAGGARIVRHLPGKGTRLRGLGQA